MTSNKLISLILPALTLSAVSCVNVSFEPLVNDNIAAVTSAFDWGTIDEHPDTMTIISTRTERELHYAFGYKYNPEPEKDKADTVSFVRGDYYSVAFGCRPDAFVLPDLKSFIVDRSYPLKNIYVSPNRIGDDNTEEEKLQEIIWDRMGFPEDLKRKVKKGTSLWEDLSPRNKVYEAEESFFWAVCRSYADPAETLTIPFEPKELTVNLEFTIPVRVSGDVEILGAFAALTGVPSYVSLMSGELEAKDLGKIYFPLSEESGVYSGSARTFGLFSPNSPTFIGGPGILCIYFILRMDTDEGELVRVSSPAMKNLWTVLGSANGTMANRILSKVEYSEKYILKTNRFTMNIPSVTVSWNGGEDVQFKWEDGGETEGDDWSDVVWGN